MTIKNYFSKPTKWAKRGAAALILAAAGMAISSCGGSGVDVATTPPPAAALRLLPGTATLFATVPANYVASGGLPPYTLLTSNAAVVPVPTGTLSSSNFTLTPNVVSTNTDVTITLRDSAGITATAVATVNPNFVNGNLTVKGNGVESPSFTGCTDIGFVCAGQFGTVTVTLTQNGAPVRARSVRFTADEGAYQFVANVVNNTLVQTIDVTTDETGTATAIIRGNVNATLQVALIRATDILTGAYRLSSFVIRQTTLSGTDFTTVPKSWAVAGFIKNQCPGGVVDYIIFGGTAPYTIRSPLSDVIVSPTTTNSDNPNRFTASFRAQPCGDVGYAPIFTITDATGRTITADLSVKPGTVDGPVNTTLTLSANAITLACGQQAQVVASVTTTATAAPTLSTAVTTSVSPATALTAAATGNTVTITRGTAVSPAVSTVGPIPNLTPPNTTATVVVGAGNAPAQTLLVTTPSTCPP